MSQVDSRISGVPAGLGLCAYRMVRECLNQMVALCRLELQTPLGIATDNGDVSRFTPASQQTEVLVMARYDANVLQDYAGRLVRSMRVSLQFWRFSFFARFVFHTSPLFSFPLCVCGQTQDALAKFRRCTVLQPGSNRVSHPLRFTRHFPISVEHCFRPRTLDTVRCQCGFGPCQCVAGNGFVTHFKTSVCDGEGISPISGMRQRAPNKRPESLFVNRHALGNCLECLFVARISDHLSSNSNEPLWWRLQFQHFFDLCFDQRLPEVSLAKPPINSASSAPPRQIHALKKPPL